MPSNADEVCHLREALSLIKTANETRDRDDLTELRKFAAVERKRYTQAIYFLFVALSVGTAPLQTTPQSGSTQPTNVVFKFSSRASNQR